MIAPKIVAKFVKIESMYHLAHELLGLIPTNLFSNTFEQANHIKKDCNANLKASDSTYAY